MASALEALQSRYRLIAVNLFGYGKTSAWPGSDASHAADQAELGPGGRRIGAEARRPDRPRRSGGPVALEASGHAPWRTPGFRLVFRAILFGYLQAHGPAGAYEEIARRPAGRYTPWRRPQLERGRRMASSTTGPVPAHGRAMSNETQAEHVAMLPAVRA
jgi:hypothetical protein